MSVAAKKLNYIDKYSVLGLLGEGFSSKVYLVEYDNQQFALKLFKTSDDASILRFRRESSTLARLDHENLLKIYDVGESNGVPFILMERLVGNPLADEIESQTKIPQDNCLPIVKCTLRALGELHKNNLIHRDIKPHNIFITSTGVTKLIDLGLVGNIEQIKTEGAFVGTPLYASPEQNKVLKRDVDFRSDLYSVAITFYEALVGRPPFIGTTTEIIQQHAARTAPDIRELNPYISAGIAVILAKALSKDPDDRYQSASGFLYDLENLAEIETIIKQSQFPKLGLQDRITKSGKVKFVPRVAETEKLINAWREVQYNRPGVAIVEGPSGSGKTRLTEEFLNKIQMSDLLVLRSKCHPFDKELPFGPIREAMDCIYDEIEASEKFLVKFRTAAAGSMPMLAGFYKRFQRLLDVHSTSQKLSNLDGDRELFFDRFADFFLKLSEQFNGVIFFIDDLQWIDQSSRLLIEKILANSKDQKILFLATARDDLSSKKKTEEIEANLSTSIHAKIQVGSFSQADMRKLVNEYLGSENIGEDISNAIFSRSKGNAFIAIEYLRAGLDQGYLSFGGGRWSINLQQLERIALSDNVNALILKRIESSSSRAREFLEFAALYGPSFRVAEIAEAAGFEEKEIQETLEFCADQALIEKVTVLKWKFVHDKIPESLISSQEPEKRRRMSDCLAHVVFSRSNQTAEEIFVTARLFAQGNADSNLRATIQSQAEAGDIAFESYSYLEAFAYYKLAFELSEKHETEEEIRIKLAPQLAISASMIGEDIIALKCSDLHVATAKTDAELAHVYGLRMWILNNSGKNVEAWEYFKKASRCIGQNYPLYLHWKILQIIWSWLLVFIGDFISIKLPQKLFLRSESLDLNKISHIYRDALLACEVRGSNIDVILVSLRFLAMAQFVGGPKERALGYTAVGFAYGNFGLRSLSIFYFNKAKHYCDLLGDPSVTAVYQMRTLLGLFYCGGIADYVGEFASRKDFLAKYLCPAEYGRIALNNGWILSFMGHHNEALEALLLILELKGKKEFRIAPHAFVTVMNQIWVQMSILGKMQAVGKIKETALAMNYEQRHAPPVVRSAVNAEVVLARVTERLDQNIDEILAAFWKHRSNKLSFPVENNVSALMTFVRLLQYQRAVTFDERFSCRLELKEMFRHLFLYLYCPLFRANYLFLKGSYHRTQNRFWLAEHYFKQAEVMASESNSLRLLFDIQRERARIYKQKGHFALMNLSLSAAFELGQKHGWIGSIQLLKSEFENFFEESVLAANTPLATAHAGQTHISDLTKQARPQVLKSSAPVPRSLTVVSTVIGAKGEIQAVRFSNALLAVSSAFTNSIDPIEQARSVLNEIIKLFAAERGFIFMKNENSDETSVLAGINSEGIELNHIKGFSSTVAKRAIQGGKTIIVAGTDEAEAIGSESAVLYNLRSIIATPLVYKEKILGAVYLDSTLTKGLFTIEDAGLFANLANHIAVAFELFRITKVELEKVELQKNLTIQSAIASEAKKVKILVDNMQQALFSVGPDGRIVEPVSRFAESVFDQPINEKSVIEVLYKDLKSDKLDLIRSSMTTVFGEDDLQWSLMQDNFARKVTYKSVGHKTDKILKVLPSPMWDQDQKLEKILFVVEDVTSLETLKLQIESSQRQTLMTQDVLSADPHNLKGFLFSSEHVIKKHQAEFQRADRPQAISLTRDLHTLKGNARLFKLGALAELVHESETTILGGVNSETEQKLVIHGELEKISSTIQEYLALFLKYKPFNRDKENGSELNLEALKELKNIIESSSEQNHLDVLRLKQSYQRIFYRSARQMIARFENMIDDLGLQLDKKAKLSIEGDVYVPEERISVLQECLLHLLRNSMDHGLETMVERAKKGKAEAGQVTVTLSELQGVIQIVITDDGRGMDAERIAQKAIEKKIISVEEAETMNASEKLNLIFRPNFSTKDAATDVSGRGIGMDVVRENISKVGGNIAVSTSLGKGSQFAIVIPQS